MSWPVTSRPSAVVSRIAALAGSAALAGAGWTATRRLPTAARRRWERTNHRGEPITLLEGPVATLAVAGGIAIVPGLPRSVRSAGVLAALGAGGVGLLDDLAESGNSKGLAGHLGALRRGEITTGLIKIVGIGATGVAAAALVGPGGHSAQGGPPQPMLRHLDSGSSSAGDAMARLIQVLIGGAVVAGSANLLNLFDLRPGRALKVVVLHTPAIASATPAGPVIAAAVGTAVALLPADLDEQAMLGDCGANALGAVLGTAALAGLGPRGRVAVLAWLVGLILASEKVSFSAVIARTPVLRELDALGRRPR